MGTLRGQRPLARALSTAGFHLAYRGDRVICRTLGAPGPWAAH